MPDRHQGPPRVTVDHLVLVARNVETTLAFYEHVLGAEIRDLEGWRNGTQEYPVLHFGEWKVNVHPADTDAAPRAGQPVPGSVDLCLRWDGPIEAAYAHLAQLDVSIELGPTAQEGACGWGRSVYFRDPDGCLLELISYEDENPRA